LREPTLDSRTLAACQCAPARIAASWPDGDRGLDSERSSRGQPQSHIFGYAEPLCLLRQFGANTGPDAYLVPNLRGGRMARQRVGEIVGEAAARASEELVARGLPPLPHTTPHTLRRTYISIVLLANNFDVKWVMSQVGHADSKMTKDVYAQLEQRAKRSHGTNFDQLISDARSRLAETAPPAPETGQKSGSKGTEKVPGPKSGRFSVRESRSTRLKKRP
jgi:hypothetical protein